MVDKTTGTPVRPGMHRKMQEMRKELRKADKPNNLWENFTQFYSRIKDQAPYKTISDETA
jgi:hypothetical protein